MTQALETMTGEMRILDRTGDSRVVWNKDEPDSIAVAQAAFDAAIAKGYWAYSVKADDPNARGTQVKKFDPKAEALILAPRMAGG